MSHFRCALGIGASQSGAAGDVVKFGRQHISDVKIGFSRLVGLGGRSASVDGQPPVDISLITVYVEGSFGVGIRAHLCHSIGDGAGFAGYIEAVTVFVATGVTA